MINTVDFDEVLPIWKTYLWPGRTSEIDATSALCYLGGYDLVNMQSTPTFFAYMIDGTIAGVNSGHMCKDNLYRSRGLYVFDEFRGRGIGVELLKITIVQARLEGASLCWSYPRQSSWRTYNKAGFSLTSDWEMSETSDNNAYCKLDL